VASYALERTKVTREPCAMPGRTFPPQEESRQQSVSLVEARAIGMLSDAVQTTGRIFW
jgi:hypothetical protein